MTIKDWKKNVSDKAIKWKGYALINLIVNSIVLLLIIMTAINAAINSRSLLALVAVIFTAPFALLIANVLYYSIPLIIDKHNKKQEVK